MALKARIEKRNMVMARLNILKMLGLILLLMIALTLPTVLPNAGQAASEQVSTPAPNNRSNV